MSETDTPRTDEFEDDLLHTTYVEGQDYRSMMEHARTLERELTSARAEMPWYANGESKEQWMQRQREKYQHLKNTIKELTEQRDRLKMALRDIRARCQDKTIELHPDSDTKGCVDDCLEWADEALQSLSTKNHE